MNHEHEQSQNDGKNTWSGTKWALIILLAVAGYSLGMQHKEHLSVLLYYLPYLVLLACPLMHLFMHHGHGRHGGDCTDDGGAAAGTPRENGKK